MPNLLKSYGESDIAVLSEEHPCVTGAAADRVRDLSVENVLAPDRGDQKWSIDSWTSITPDDAVLPVPDASLKDI